MADAAATSSEPAAVPNVDELHAVGPYVVQGLVVPGFKRGSKELGIPTGTAIVPQHVTYPQALY